MEPGADRLSTSAASLDCQTYLCLFGRYRRLRKDYEQLIENSEAMIYLASIHIILKRTPMTA